MCSDQNGWGVVDEDFERDYQDLECRAGYSALAVVESQLLGNPLVKKLMHIAWTQGKKRQQRTVKSDATVKANPEQEAIKALLNAMEMQEKRETGAFHIPQHTARPIWDEAKAKGIAALSSKSRAGV